MLRLPCGSLTTALDLASAPIGRGASLHASTFATFRSSRLFSTSSSGSPPVDTTASSPIPGDTSTPAAGYKPTPQESVADYSSLVPKIVVFGGSGFVGTRVCKHIVGMGADVVSVSRHGRPASATGAWADSVQWAKGDIFDPQSGWKDLLKGSAGVVSTLGAFGSNEFMYKICGQANIDVMDAAADLKVPRFAFISVHDYHFPGGWHAKDFLLKGYFQGKRDAEAHLFKLFPESGVALRPGFIYGSRAAGNMTIPLGVVGVPLAAALKLLPTRSLAGIPILGAAFVPPVSVDAVGKAAATSVMDLTTPAGIMDVWTIATFA